LRAAAAPARRAIDPIAWLALPAALYFVVALAIPLVALLGESLRGPDGFGFANYVAYLGDDFNRAVVANTVRYASLVTVLSLVVGYAYAYAMIRVGPALQMGLLLAIILPMTASVIVKTFGWQILLRSNGPVNQAMVGLGLIDAPVQLLFTETGLFVGTTSILLPYMVLPIFGVLRQIPREQEEAAACLGAGPAFRFLHVVLPLSAPGIVAGVAFVFSMAVSAYVIPSLLTGAGYKTLSKVAANAFLVIQNPAQGSTVSVLLLLIAGATVIVAGILLARLRR
jgi:putative spermidine/putrescine transport system permease protein